MAKATAPSRSSGSLTISVGLVNVPVSVYSGTEDTGVKRSRYSPAGNPVGMKNFDKVTGEDVEYGDLVMRYATPDGKLVELSDDEVAAASGASNGAAEVIAVLKRSFLDEYAQESLLQIRPQNGGKAKQSPVAVKAYALLMAALTKMDAFLLVRYSLRGKVRIGAVTGDGYLRVLYFDDEIRQTLAKPDPATSGVTEQELDLATQLLEVYEVDDAPQVEDESSAKVRAYAEAKAEGGDVIEMESTPAPVSDLMAALTASVEAAKKAS